MSAAEQLIPEPRPMGEVERARMEDPTFPELRARAIAKGRGETYSRERHGPFELKAPPKIVREKDDVPDPDAALASLLDRFRAKGQPRLQAIPNAERDDVRRVREL